MKRGNDKQRGGAALMLSLWALFLLSGMVISWALEIDSRMTLNGNANRVLEAEAMACSGSEIALHPGVQPGSPILRGGASATQTYEARITGEGGRLNLNWVAVPENPQKLELLRKFLETKGIDLNERDHMIDCLLDWTDPDNLVRLNGAEDEGDYKPANSSLTRIEDVKRIKGWAEFVARPGWDSELTMLSTGPIDLKWASRDVLLSLPGMTEPVVDQFLALRSGPDGIDGTEDDPPLKTEDDMRIALGFSLDQYKQLTGLVAKGRDPTMRVTSVGKSGNVTRTVEVVFVRTGNTPTLKTWKEL